MHGADPAIGGTSDFSQGERKYSSTFQQFILNERGPKMRKKFDAGKRTQILAYIEKYNARNNGRGGQSAAAKKFKVSRVAINNWLKQGPSNAKKPKKAKQVKKAGRTSGKLINKKMVPVIIALEIIQEGIAELEKALKAIL
jgi:hypothetical protein